MNLTISILLLAGMASVGCNAKISDDSTVSDDSTSDDSTTGDDSTGDDSTVSDAAPEYRYLNLSLGVDDTSFVPEQPGDSGGQYNSYTISGEVVALGAYAASANMLLVDSNVDKQVAVLDGDGRTWTLGVGVTDSDDVYLTPTLDLTVGDTVTLTFEHSDAVFYNNAGASLTDTQGVVFGGRTGNGDPTFIDETLLTFGVASGELTNLDEEEDPCGIREHRELVFHSDEATAVAPGTDETFSTDGVTLTASALMNYDLKEIACEDDSSRSHWIVWR